MSWVWCLSASVWLCKVLGQIFGLPPADVETVDVLMAELLLWSVPPVRSGKTVFVFTALPGNFDTEQSEISCLKFADFQ